MDLVTLTVDSPAHCQQRRYEYRAYRHTQYNLGNRKKYVWKATQSSDLSRYWLRVFQKDAVHIARCLVSRLSYCAHSPF